MGKGSSSPTGTDNRVQEMIPWIDELTWAFYYNPDLDGAIWRVLNWRMRLIKWRMRARVQTI